MSSDNQIASHHQMVLVSKTALDNLTEGIAASLSRVKDLEDQVKVIPSLQRTVDMMLQSSCSSNGFCTTNSQRSTPSTTSLESNTNHLTRLRNSNSNSKSIHTAASNNNYNCSPTDRGVTSPVDGKVDFEDLINDLISLSYSVNYINSSSSNSSNTIASSVNNNSTGQRCYHKPGAIINSNHSLPSVVKHDRLANICHKKHYSSNNNSKPPTSLPCTVETDRGDDEAKNHYSCPTFFSTLTQNSMPAAANKQITQQTKISNKRTKDAAVNTDLFMEDIITRNELNSYIRSQQPGDDVSRATGCSAHWIPAQQNQSTRRAKVHSVVTRDIAVDCSIGGTPTLREPTSSSVTTTSSTHFFTNSTSKQHSDTGYDSFERCEAATQVDKNLWAIMNYLGQGDTSTTLGQPQVTVRSPAPAGTAATPNEHVTTIVINQAQTEQLPAAAANMSGLYGDNKLMTSRDMGTAKQIIIATNYNGSINSKATNDSDSGEKVQIKVELPTSGHHKFVRASRSGKTSIPISISSLSSSSCASNPLNNDSGQLFSELTTSSDEDNEEKDSDHASDSGDSTQHDTSDQLSSASSDDETSLSEDDDDDDDDDGDAASSLGSYQDPSDFEEYCAFGLTVPLGEIRPEKSSEKAPQSATTASASVNAFRQPSKELKEALKHLADHLREDDDLSGLQELTSCFEVIRKEWFGVATRKDSCYQLARVYLNLFESHSKQLLNTVVNLTDIAGNSVLHYAASHFNYNLLNVLLDTKICDMNRRNRAGYTPIMLLALADIGDHFKEMVARRVFQLGNVNIKATQNGQTALMLAVSHGRTKTCKILLDCGADPSLQDKDGSTALMCASEIGHLEIVKCLLAHKLTDPHTTDNDGLDALAIAMDNGHRDVGLVLYAAKNMLRTTSGSSGVGASLRRTSSKSSSLYPLRRSDSLASSKNRPPTRARL